MSRCKVRAHANIALSKYWGKSDLALNLPAVPSVSMTLDGLVTETEVRFDTRLRTDRVFLDGRRASAAERQRVVEVLDQVRSAAGHLQRAEVRSANHFPTAAGLASSASGFAALAAAATRAAELDWDDKRVSALARQASASAARSVFGGFVELPAGKPGQASLAARPLHDERYWDLRIVVAETAKGPKKVGSTAGMERSRRTSPYYEAWVAAAPKLSAQVKRGLKLRHLPLLGAAMEQSTLAFHACAMASAPGILYFQPATLAALATVRDLRDRRGVEVFATMDAGPHVKALCHVDDVGRVRRALTRTEGVIATGVSAPGPGVEILEWD